MGTCSQQRLPDAMLLSLLLHPFAGSAQIKLHSRRDLFPFHNFCRRRQVLESRVHARKQVSLLNRDLLLFHRRQRLHHLNGVGARDVRRNIPKIKHNAGGIHCIRIRPRRILLPVLDVLIGEAFDSHRCQAPLHTFKIFNRDFVHWEPAHQRSPLGRHVRDGEPRIHRQAGYSRSSELDCRVQHLIVVVETAQSDDDVFPGCSVRQSPFEHHLDGPRYLPPELSGCPDGCRVSANNWGAHGTNGPIHIRMRVRSHYERSRYCISALHHDLVTNARACGIEINSVLLGECLYGAIFGLVRFVFVLNVVIECKNKLFGIVNLLRADALEFLHHRRSVVVGHYMMRSNRDEVSRAQGPLWTLAQMRLRDLFNNSLAHNQLTSSWDSCESSSLAHPPSAAP